MGGKGQRVEKKGQERGVEGGRERTQVHKYEILQKYKTKKRERMQREEVKENDVCVWHVCVRMYVCMCYVYACICVYVYVCVYVSKSHTILIKYIFLDNSCPFFQLISKHIPILVLQWCILVLTILVKDWLAFLWLA